MLAWIVRTDLSSGCAHFALLAICFGLIIRVSIESPFYQIDDSLRGSSNRLLFSLPSSSSDAAKPQVALESGAQSFTISIRSR